MDKNTVDFSKVDIRIVGKTLAMTLPITLVELKQIERLRPESLQIKDKDGGLKFKVASGTNGSISTFGITFNDFTRDERKLAFMSVDLKGDFEDARKHVADEYGVAIIGLKNVIAHLGKAAESIEVEMEEILGYIKFADDIGDVNTAEGDNND
jgi:hypothetical protein